MKISILTSDFSSNSFGRTWLLAKLLNKHYKIEVIGPSYNGIIWPPLEDNCDFEMKIFKGFSKGKFEFKEILRNIYGDVIYACKPLFPSFGTGLLKKFLKNKPLILDIDDLETGFGKSFYESLTWYQKINDLILSLPNLNSYYYKIFLDKFFPFADDITVSSRSLQNRYGGTIIPHARDVHFFDPDIYDKYECRNKIIPEKYKNSFCIGFFGTPKLHKGIEDLIDAISLLKIDDVLLVLVGFDRDNYYEELKEHAKKRGIFDKITFFPPQPFQKLPQFLSFIDLIVIPQKETEFTRAQIPAKLFDAMAMAKPIISTKISDIPVILGNCGWVVEPDNHRQLSNKIRYVYEHPDEAESRGLKARDKCIREFSYEAVESNLYSIFDRYSFKN